MEERVKKQIKERLGYRILDYTLLKSYNRTSKYNKYMRYYGYRRASSILEPNIDIYITDIGHLEVKDKKLTALFIVFSTTHEVLYTRLEHLEDYNKHKKFFELGNDADKVVIPYLI